MKLKSKLRSVAWLKSIAAAVLLPAAWLPVCAAETNPYLWQIGVADHDDHEFALAPNHYAEFREDGFFVVSRSDQKRDWPYVHPGPVDGWAGARQHTFGILFGIKNRPVEGTCHLRVGLVDTHRQSPPVLRVSLNGQDTIQRLPAGGGDESVLGQPGRVKAHRFEVEFAAATLQPGANEITITTLSGSWLIYDWLGFEAPPGTELTEVSGTMVTSLSSPPVVVERNGAPVQTLAIVIRQCSQATNALVRVDGAVITNLNLGVTPQRFEVVIPAVVKETPIKVAVEVGGEMVATRTLTLKPIRHWVVYLMPQSHVDIGFTHRQADVERKQWENIDTALELCRKTASYPVEARFKWNVEILWAVDSYLRKAPPEKQQKLIDAIRGGQVGLDALYGNELTGLCRPEELLRLFGWAAIIGQRCGVKVESAMISDVPGMTWGMVAASAQAGVKYFSLGFSFSDGGRTYPAWENKPFYWLGPDGRQKILCWLPYRGYSLGHRGYKLNERLLETLAQLEQRGFPYDVVQLRWSVGGDNGPPDATLSEVVKAWNMEHVWPKMVIATTAEAFREFEKRYAEQVPAVAGDLTPFWENGACSSARETAVNRTAAERLVQAETLSAILGSKPRLGEQFIEAWRNVILYDEHTWGAYNSISDPDLPFVKEQWRVKQAFALDADVQSRNLLSTVLAGRDGEPSPGAVDVFNTASWRRSGLVILGKEVSAGGDVVTGPEGEAVRSQRLSTGELAFLAREVPALAGKRYFIGAGKASSQGQAKAAGTTLSSPAVAVKLDPLTGVIASLRSAARPEDLSDMSLGVGLNHYSYVLGNRVRDAQEAAAATITVKEPGPLVASLLVESDAPGCVKFCREVRVIDGLGHVEILDLVDKKAVREKEAIHLGFAFNVPDGVMRMDIPWAVMRPEIDQIAGACKNWFCAGRWVDVSSRQYGVTWATLDAPLVEVGAITADKIGSVPNPNDWLARLEPSQTLYSMVMNNHWFTNYKADQDGPTMFRYAVLPHGQYDAAAAQRFGIESSQPLVAVSARGLAPGGQPFLTLETAEVLVASIKPSEDGGAWIVRLFNVGAKAAKSRFSWGRPAPKTVWISNLAEEAVTDAKGVIEIPASGLVTLRAEITE